MPTLQSTGIGSGLDVNGLVTQLVAAERGPKQTQILKQQTEVAAKISAMGSLKGALGAFQASLAQLKTADAFTARSAKSGDDKVFTASATSAATPGSYGIEVTQLAKAQQLGSDAFDGTAEVGTGLLEIELGEDSFTINIDSNNSTLAEIRDAINQASDNVGVQATIVNSDEGAHLVLTSTVTGEANAIRITTSEGDGGLSRLTYGAPGNVANYTELKPAQDAIIEIAGFAGFEHRSDSNTVEDVIDGVTLRLLKEDPGVEISLDVKADLDTATSRINNFVTQYNSLQTTIAGLRSYNAATKKAGPLLGDAMLRGIEGDLRNGLTQAVDGAQEPYQTLSSLGITTKKDGTLQVDATKLRTALETNSDAVAHMFASEDGVAAGLDKFIAPHLAADGDIAARNKTLDKRTAALAKDQTILDSRMAVVQQRYLKQFTALDSLLSNMQTTSSYLAQQLANLPKIGQ